MSSESRTHRSAGGKATPALLTTPYGDNAYPSRCVRESVIDPPLLAVIPALLAVPLEGIRSLLDNFPVKGLC